MKLLKKKLVREHSPPNSIAIFTILTFKPTNMKTIKLLIIATILFTINANSQITKGNWMVGGSGSYNNTTVKDKNGTNSVVKGYGFWIRPNIGYFFANNFAGGAKLSFSYGNQKDGYSNVSYGLGPFVRYYFLKPEKIVNVFAEANYNYYISKTQNFNSTNSYNYNFKAGPEIFFNSSVGLELTLNYSISNFNTYTSNLFSVEVGFQIHLEK